MPQTANLSESSLARRELPVEVIDLTSGFVCLLDKSKVPGEAFFPLAETERARTESPLRFPLVIETAPHKNCVYRMVVTREMIDAC